MNPVQVVYSFNVSQQGDGYRFQYDQARLSGVALVSNIFLIVLLAFLVGNMSGLTDGLMSVLFIIAALLILIFGIKALVSRKSESFLVNPREVVIKNQIYQREHIKALFVKDPDQPMTRSGGTYIVAGGRGVTGGLMAGTAIATGILSKVGQAASEANADAGRKIRYKICFLYGEKEITLAKNLRENTAKALLEKIVEIL